MLQYLFSYRALRQVSFHMRLNVLNLVLTACFCLIVFIAGVQFFGDRPWVYIGSFIIGFALYALFSWFIALQLWKRDQKPKILKGDE